MSTYSGCCKREIRKVVNYVEDIVCRRPAPLPCGVSPVVEGCGCGQSSCGQQASSCCGQPSSCAPVVTPCGNTCSTKTVEIIP